MNGKGAATRRGMHWTRPTLEAMKARRQTQYPPVQPSAAVAVGAQGDPVPDLQCRCSLPSGEPKPGDLPASPAPLRGAGDRHPLDRRSAGNRSQ